MYKSVFFCFCFLQVIMLPAKDFNILDFGAKATSTALNTTAIQSAIDAAHSAGGGRVIIPAGHFLSGSIILKTGVELHLMENAVLLGTTDPAQYIKINRWKALVMADKQSNIAITGTGTIDGQGRRLALNIDSLFYIGQIDSINYNFVEMRPKEPLRPQLVEFVDCSNINIVGVTMRNAACWVQTYERCRNLLMDGIKVYSDAYWNNDGIDISDCVNVRITNCDVNTADDGICLKSHAVDLFCDSIYIANCTIRSSASAIKFGTASYGGFKNVTIEHIKVYDTFRSAIAIESVDGGFIENILVDDITATNTGNAIFIRLGKRNKARPPGYVRNITIRNMEVEVAFERMDYAYDIRGPELPFFHNVFPSSITGIQTYRVENVTLENINIQYPGRGNNGLAYSPLHRLDYVPERAASYPEFSMFGELPAWGLYVRHMDGLVMKNVSLSIREADYRPAVVFDDVRNLDIRQTRVTGDTKPKHFILHHTDYVKCDAEDKMQLIK
jgi:hypothetical protein